VRSQSPVRVVLPHEEAALAHAAQAAAFQYTHSFSLYEQHKEQREQREHVEYQRIQTEHQRSYEINQFSQGVRDRIIATYRAEIESHKLNDRDFCSLKAHIEDLRRRREAMDASVAALQGDFEAQLSSQDSVIASLRNEHEMMKTQNADKQKEGIEVSEQTAAVRVEISEREKELRDLQHDIQTTVQHNQSLEREIDNIKASIQECQELRHRQQNTIYQSNGALSKWEQECYA